MNLLGEHDRVLEAERESLRLREERKELEEALREALGYVKHFPGDIVEQELIEKIEALLTKFPEVNNT